MSYSPSHLFFDDVEVNQSWRSADRTITDADIVTFAALSGDYNPIHVDPAYAATTPFGGVIAHGLLTLAVGSGLGTNAPPMRTMAVLCIREWHFREAVKPGDTIHAVTTVLEKTPKARGRRGEIVWGRKFYNQHGQIVMEGTTLTLVEGRANVKPSASPQTQE